MPTPPDLYSCRRYRFYAQFHSHSQKFRGGIEDRHLDFRFIGVNVNDRRFRVVVELEMNSSDSYVFPPLLE
jgi:hypothetical protein